MAQYVCLLHPCGRDQHSTSCLQVLASGCCFNIILSPRVLLHAWPCHLILGKQILAVLGLNLRLLSSYLQHSMAQYDIA